MRAKYLKNQHFLKESIRLSGLEEYNELQTDITKKDWYGEWGEVMKSPLGMIIG